MSSDDSNHVQRRREVMDLLRRGTSQKLHRGGSTGALEAIREAYNKAHGDAALESPWPQLSAYRLGHLLLRSAETYDTLQEIDGYFAEATKDEMLGPLPRIYRLAVLHRLLECARGAEERQTLKNRIRTVHQAAIKQVKGGFSRPSNETRGIGRNRQTQIQDGIVNLLELATYFIAGDYSSIEGLSMLDSPFSDLNLGGEDWRLVGRDRALRNISYPRALAEAELSALAEKYPDAVLYRIAGGGEKAEWKLPNGPWRSSKNVKLLDCLLQLGGPATSSQLADRVGLENSEAARKGIERLRGELMNAYPGSSIIDRSENRYTLAADFVVFGIVNRPRNTSAE